MHFLIVDDDSSVRRTLERVLKGAGYTADRGHRISYAENGDVCRRIVADDGPVDVIFMDGELGPGDTGSVVVSRLREAGYTAKIIMTSSHAGMVQAGLTAGANASCDKTDLYVKTLEVLTGFGVPPP